MTTIISDTTMTAISAADGEDDDDSLSPSVILAIDVGSSSVRCTAYRWGGGNTLESIYGCSSSGHFHCIQHDSSGRIHLTDKNMLLDVIDLCIDDELKRLGAFSDESFTVVGLGFSTLVMNLIGVDDEGEIVGSVASMSYACNSKKVNEEVLLLQEQMGLDRLKDYHQRTGTPIHSAYALPQLRSFYRHHLPDAKHVYKWQTIAGLCLSRWTGRDWCSMSYSEASWTGLMDFRTCKWDKEALALLPEACRDALPPLEDCTHSFNGIPEFPECLTGEGADSSVASVKVNPYWKKWPELRGGESSGCRLFLGIGDGACANVGSKCTTPSRISVTIGTSAAARVVIPMEISAKEQFAVPDGLFCYRLDKSHVLLGGALTDGGSVVAWCRSLLNLETDDAFDNCMSVVKDMMDAEYLETKKPSSGDKILTMIPFLSGERSTGYRTGASGSLLGLTRETTPAHVLKASLEGVVLRLHAILKRIRYALQDTKYHSVPPRIVASGAALEHNEVWRQMLADCSGMPVERNADASTEATSRGVARMVATALEMEGTTSSNKKDSTELLKDEASATSSTQVCNPHPSATVAYWRHAAKAQEERIQAVSATWQK